MSSTPVQRDDGLPADTFGAAGVAGPANASSGAGATNARSAHSTGAVERAAVAPSLRRRSRVAMWVFLIPAILFQVVWGYYPLLAAFVVSVSSGDIIKPSHFVGLANFTRIVHDPLVIDSVRVTFVLAALSLGLTFMIPIIIAIFIMEMPKKIVYAMIILWFLPVSGLAGTLLTKYEYNAQYGLFETIATQWLHLPHQPFLNDPNQVLFWFVAPGLIMWGPGLIYMAGLQSVPASYYEAAEVEGAGFWRKIWTVSLPRLRPLISLTLALGIIGSLQSFEGPLLLTGGGPGGASRTTVLYLYELITQQVDYADATALSVLLFFVLLILIVAFRRLFPEDPDADTQTSLFAGAARVIARRAPVVPAGVASQAGAEPESGADLSTERLMLDAGEHRAHTPNTSEER